MKRFVFLFAQVFLLTVPFQFALVPYAGIDLPFTRVLAPALFFAWLAEGMASRRIDIPRSKTAAWLLILFFLLSFSIFFAAESSWAYRRATFFLSYAPLYLVFSSLSRRHGPEGVRRLLQAFVFGAALSAVVAIVESMAQLYVGAPVAYHFWIDRVLPFFLGPGFSEAVAEYPSLLAEVGGQTVLRASAFFPDPHMFSFYMGLALPVSVGLWHDSNSSRRVVFLVSSFLLLSADLLSFSRGGYVGMFVGLALVAVLILRRLNIRKPQVALLLVLSMIGFLAVLNSPFRERFVSSFSLSEGSNTGRLSLFQGAVQDIASQPYGYGLGNYPLVVNPSAEYREPIYAHNLLLDIATEAGIIASITFFLAWLASFRRLLRFSNDIIPLSIAVSLAIFFGHSLFETPLYSVHVLPILLLFLALPDAFGRIES
ncbi:MAG: O-antigen ligase family protein [Candidatus Moraniibacteriota bacterium]